MKEIVECKTNEHRGMSDFIGRLRGGSGMAVFRRKSMSFAPIMGDFAAGQILRCAVLGRKSVVLAADAA